MRAAATLLLAVGLVAPCGARGVPILFLVAEPPGAVVHGDAYVLPLGDPADIAHARALIALGPAAGATIAVATIAPDADGINRDLLAPGAPAWSWHVTGFVGFFDITAEILDGWPGFVEQDVDGWIANTGGEIGFWGYTVVRELGVPEPAAGLLVLVGAAGAACRRRGARAEERARTRAMAAICPSAAERGRPRRPGRARSRACQGADSSS